MKVSVDNCKDSNKSKNSPNSIKKSKLKNYKSFVPREIVDYKYDIMTNQKLSGDIKGHFIDINEIGSSIDEMCEFSLSNIDSESTRNKREIPEIPNINPSDKSVFAQIINNLPSKKNIQDLKKENVFSNKCSKDYNENYIIQNTTGIKLSGVNNNTKFAVSKLPINNLRKFKEDKSLSKKEDSTGLCKIPISKQELYNTNSLIVDISYKKNIGSEHKKKPLTINKPTTHVISKAAESKSKCLKIIDPGRKESHQTCACIIF